MFYRSAIVMKPDLFNTVKSIPPIPLFTRKGGRRFSFPRAFVLTILLPFILVAGCSGGDGKEETPLTPSSRKLFVTNTGGDRISIFDANARGNVAPIRSIGSNTGLQTGSGPRGIFVDKENDEIFVTCCGKIIVYGRTDEGDVTPLRTIEGLNTGLFNPQGIFVDIENNEIFVTNFGNNTITVYGRTDAGDVSPLRTIGGSSTRLNTPVGIFVDTENNEIFVVNGHFFFREEGLPNNDVLVYQRMDEGNVPPLRSINILEQTDEGVPFVPTAIYVDTDNDEIFVVDFAPPEVVPLLVPIQRVFESTIKVYRRTDKGDVAPLRTIRGPNTGLFNPQGIFVDIENNEIFVTNSFNNTVTVYGRTDTEDVHPSRTLSILDSNNAGILGVQGMSSGIFVDIENNEIFVANINNTITVYRRTDEGGAPPLRIIGPNTGLLAPVGIYVDTENKEIFVINSFSLLITVYGITDEGNAAPLRTISQGLLFPTGIFIDTENDEIFVTNAVLFFVGGNFFINNTITVYRRTDGTLLRAILGLNTGLEATPAGIFVDTKNDEIFVTNFDTITVYGRTDEGDVPPLRTIEGPNTGLDAPAGIFVDTENNEIFVTNLGDTTNSGDDTITVYRRTDKGDVAPLRTIRGPNTGLFNPQGIFVDIENNEIFVTNSFNNTITVYGRTDQGDVSPLRTIEGPNTKLAMPWGIFVAESP